jgi:hypothetical protein
VRVIMTVALSRVIGSAIVAVLVAMLVAMIVGALHRVSVLAYAPGAKL